MLRAVAKGLWRTRYLLYSNEDQVGEFTRSIWSCRGQITLGGRSWEIRREGWFGPVLLVSDDGIAVRAAKVSSLRARFSISYDNRVCELRRTEFLWRTMVFARDGVAVGRMANTGWSICRKVDAELPADVPLEVQAFLVWLFVWYCVRHT
jgi:hypothetical protein